MLRPQVDLQVAPHLDLDGVAEGIQCGLCLLPVQLVSIPGGLVHLSLELHLAASDHPLGWANGVCELCSRVRSGDVSPRAQLCRVGQAALYMAAAVMWTGSQPATATLHAWTIQPWVASTCQLWSSIYCAKSSTRRHCRAVLNLVVWDDEHTATKALQDHHAIKAFCQPSQGPTIS